MNKTIMNSDLIASQLTSLRAIQAIGLLVAAFSLINQIPLYEKQANALHRMQNTINQLKLNIKK